MAKNSTPAIIDNTETSMESTNMSEDLQTDGIELKSGNYTVTIETRKNVNTSYYIVKVRSNTLLSNFTVTKGELPVLINALELLKEKVSKPTS